MEYDQKGFWRFGSTRTVGYYSNLEESQRIVKNNVCDLCETIYDYAIIEEIEIDCLYPTVLKQELYKVKDPTIIIDGKEVYNHKLTYEQINLPENFPQNSIVIS